jgi:hypothetical protein
MIVVGFGQIAHVIHHDHETWPGLATVAARAHAVDISNREPATSPGG